jgi:Coenzyme PQQ synthesis protein D (PqqD)
VTGAGPQEQGGARNGRLRPAEDVVARRLGDETVVVNLRTNLIYELNRTGARLWELLADGCDRPELERRLAREFDVEADTLRREIDALLSSLLAAGLVTDAGT